LGPPVDSELAYAQVGIGWMRTQRIFEFVIKILHSWDTLHYFTDKNNFIDEFLEMKGERVRFLWKNTI
jgi:hypothetical protein